jgi:hypothetical protein
MDLTQIYNNDVAKIKSIRQAILDFEKLFQKIPSAVHGDNDLMPLTHKFCDGFYVREIFIPKDMILTGRIHKHSHPNFLLEGEVDVFTESGGVEHLKAPMSIISAAGTKRVVRTYTDTRWVTVHLNKNNTTDIKELDDYVIAPTYEAYDKFKKKESRKKYLRDGIKLITKFFKH